MRGRWRRLKKAPEDCGALIHPKLGRGSIYRADQSLAHVKAIIDAHYDLAHILFGIDT
jgi:hypothetical protein